MDPAHPAHVCKQTGVGIRERQPADLMSVSVKFALEVIGDRAEGFRPVLVLGRECGKIDVGRQPVVPAPDNILHTCRVRVRRVGRYVLGVCDLHPLRSRTDLEPLAAARRTGRGVCGAHL